MSMLRGIDGKQELDPRQLLRDTRTTGQRVGDFFKDRVGVTIVIISLALAAFFVPSIADICLALGAVSFATTMLQRQVLPFRMPQFAKIKDYNDLAPGTKTPRLSRGITHFGNDSKSNEELWFSNEDMRTHVLIFGSTGSGKTEALISIAYSSLLQSSGFIYVDGKGDNSLYAKVFSMARSLGREDDLLLVNFMTGARDIVGPQEKRLSNTLNPFATGSSSMLSQLVISLMESSSQSSDGDMWKGRAISFVEALMRLLVYMRDQDALLLDANTIRNYFHLNKLEAIVIDSAFPRDGDEAVSLDNVPDIVMEPIRNYVYNLPGYNREKKGKQVSQVLEQHGFITMQLTRVFSSLADAYGHILRTKLAEVDFKDVVLNRRILVVLLPALEKSPDELSNLGKVIIASLKAMMAAGLGEDVEGEYHEVIERKPTNAPTPYLCIMDEYGYYAVQGFAVVPAQARSLGFSTVFAGQDLPAFQKASKEEAASIGANTNIKICMKLEDPTETWDFFTKTAGEAYVTKVDSFQTKETSVTNSYLDTKSSSFEKRARVDLLDLKEQTEGEAHIFFRSKIVRAKMFYANPKPVKRLKINQFLKIGCPTDKELAQMDKTLRNFTQLVKAGDIRIPHVESEQEEDLRMIVDSLRENSHLDPIQRGVAALQACYKQTEPEEVETIDVTVPDNSLNVFSALRYVEPAQILSQDKTEFAQPLLGYPSLQTDISALERAAGKRGSQANNIASEIIRDVLSATYYPPEYLDDIPVSDLVVAINQLSDAVVEGRSNKE